MNIRYDSVSFTENEFSRWFVTTTGKVYRVNKKFQDIEQHRCFITPYKHHKSICINANNKDYVLNTLVIRTFIRKFKNKRFLAGHKDENRFNCDINNLYVISYKNHGINTGYMSRSKPVSVRDKRIKGKRVIKYRSVRESAKALHVSYQTVLDYMNGEVKHSILCDYDIKYIKEMIK